MVRLPESVARLLREAVAPEASDDLMLGNIAQAINVLQGSIRQALLFVWRIASMTKPGVVCCPECGAELEEAGLGLYECSGCAITYPVTKVDEWRFDNAEDNALALAHLINEARILAKLTGGSQ